MRYGKNPMSKANWSQHTDGQQILTKEEYQAFWANSDALHWASYWAHNTNH